MPAQQQHHSLAADVRRLARRAAILGALLAIACHLVPPHYRVVCDQVAQLCQLGSSTP